MRTALFVAAALLAGAPPVSAQDKGAPMLRVYLDTPYHYDILVAVDDDADPRAMTLVLTVEGKEVGQSLLVYDCKTGAFDQTVKQPWTGGADRYIPAALMAFADLRC